MRTFKIHAPLNPQEAYVEMDGNRLDGVVGISFAIAAKKATMVSLVVMGEVEVEGEFRESEIVRVERQDSGMLRARVRRTFRGAFPGRADDEIKALTDGVMRDLEDDGAPA